MVLRMARPVRHPTTGIYQFRKRVPDALRPVLGKREEKISLGTRDPSEAKEAHARVTAEVEARWRQLSAGVQTLSQREAEAVAGEIYRSMIADHEDNPGRLPEGLMRLVLERRAQRTEKVRVYPMGADPEKSKALLDRIDRRRQEDNARRVDDWLAAKGLLLTPESRGELGRAVERAILQAREQLSRMSKGDYRPDPDGDRFPTFEAGKRKSAHGKRSPLAVFDDYAKEAEVVARTVKRWRPIIAAIDKEVPDMAGMTPEWVVEWKDRLIARGLSTRTVRDVNHY